jgi:hypothetical protein
LDTSGRRAEGMVFSQALVAFSAGNRWASDMQGPER